MAERVADNIPAAIPRAALVTGAAKRLGKAIALALAEAGFAVALHCRKWDAVAEQTLNELRATSPQTVLIEADLRDEHAVGAIIPQATEALGPLGVLVNNASAFERDEWDTVTRDSWDLHLEPNLRAPFVLTQLFARALPDDAEGMVLNMIDQRVWSITPHFVSYTVSKAGLWALTQSLALALAPRIRVNAIGPGPALPNQRQTEAQFAHQVSRLPLRRGPQPAEIARAALALLALPSVTGQMLALDGGQHLNWHPPASAPHSDAGE
ncbi:MAG TPA: SDR family oxidoreductase [Acidisphaera sp.]|nr:SDR family oxidoreductase [Acidisphaera sp.]